MALVDDQVRVKSIFVCVELILADIDTVGAGGVLPPPLSPPPLFPPLPPPHENKIIEKDKTKKLEVIFMLVYSFIVAIAIFKD